MTKTKLSLRQPELIIDKPSIIELETLREAGRLTAQLLDEYFEIVKPGITTKEIDEYCLDFCERNDVVPAPLNYRGFPNAVCTSVNHVICHGIPNKKPLLEGDIVNIDVTLIKDGWHADSSRTFGVGKIPVFAKKLAETTYKCLLTGIEYAKVGYTTGDLGFAIQELAHSRGFSVVREFCGHGIGRSFHLPPNISHFGKKGEGIPLREGMIFTIEPMINLGKPQIRMLNDGWTAITRDRKLSAQYEHTIVVTDDQPEIITKSLKNLDMPPLSV